MKGIVPLEWQLTRNREVYKKFYSHLCHYKQGEIEEFGKYVLKNVSIVLQNIFHDQQGNWK